MKIQISTSAAPVCDDPHKLPHGLDVETISVVKNVGGDPGHTAFYLFAPSTKMMPHALYGVQCRYPQDPKAVRKELKKLFPRALFKNQT